MWRYSKANEKLPRCRGVLRSLGGCRLGVLRVPRARLGPFRLILEAFARASPFSVLAHPPMSDAFYGASPSSSSPPGTVTRLSRQRRSCYNRNNPRFAMYASVIPTINAKPTFHIANAAVTSVMNRSPLFLLKSQEPRARCAPVKNKITPSTARGNTLKIASMDPLKQNARHSRIVPRMIGAPPVRAPNATWPAMPPAPWHMGTPPTAAPARFIKPVDVATDLSVTG